MSFLSWNCRGLNNQESPAIPYLVWLTSKFKPSFLFLQETKTTVANVHRLLRATNPSFCYGVDADETRGGLVLFCWGPYVVDIVEKSGFFLLCKITEINGQEWHCLFLYGAPSLSHRLALWTQLHQLLSPYQKILILGDINQLDRHEDKMGGSALIGGWADFISWKMALNLQDIPFSGPRFTWSNNREEDQLLMECLDRGYASTEWLQLYPQAYIRNLPIIHSDHGPILLQITPIHFAARRPYQIENWSIRFHEVYVMVHEVWDLFIAGSAAYSLTRRLEILRNKIKSWCLDRRLFWGVNWQRIFDQLDFQGQHITSTGHGVAYSRQHHHLINEATMALTYWRQRIRNNVIQIGDLPSKLLFRRLRQKQQQTNLYMLRLEDSSWITTPTEIETHIKQHFQSLLTSSSSHPANSTNDIDLVLRELDLPVLTAQESNALLRPITPEEISLSLFSQADNKSPGLDGFNAEFFKYYWPTIGPTITSAIQRFFATGFLLKEWNATLLVLIPKVTPPQEVNHLRPISPCNVLYKCIAKCMVNRMQQLLPSLISDYQNAFIPGRNMEDSILLTHELTHTINKQRRNHKYLATLKLDMNKAYDRVKWDFLI